VVSGICLVEELNMPLPLAVNLKVAGHLARARLRRRHARVPVVLMLELTHACNLRCAGCGRIREYAGASGSTLTREQARAAILEAGTPFVSISGGEPLLHADAPAIAADVLALRKVIYFCTNGLLLAQRLDEFVPHRHFYFNVHLDGPAHIHDRLAGLPGTTERALEAIRRAKKAGFGVTVNTTLYHETTIPDVVALYEQLTDMGVDGLMIAPAFSYEVGVEAGTLTRAEAQERFRALRANWGDRNMYHTPLYMQFLSGERELRCMPWGTVTYNPQGWKRPCYLLTDAHVPSLDELINDTDWNAYGRGMDERCAHCMLHSGFEPSVMNSMRGIRDWIQMIRWQLRG
jgi:hopanoid biosynthesis associated radical SAM protein HpnH